MKARSDTVLRARSALFVAIFVLVWCLAGAEAYAQQLRFSLEHRDINPPDYATFRVGPLYSHFSLSQEAGVRYTEGTLNTLESIDGIQRGAFLTNGIDYPLITSVSLHNYLMISKYMDLDMAIWARYEYYPLETQEDLFLMNLTDPQISSSFVWEFIPADNVRVKVYDRPAYLMEYVDQRGTSDLYGGEPFRRFQNDAGVDADILLASDMNLALSLSRFDLLGASTNFTDQERTSYDERAAFEYQATPLLTVGVSADYAQSDYVVIRRSDFSSQTYSVFAGEELSPSSRVSASIGYAIGETQTTSNSAVWIEQDAIVGSLSYENEIWKDIVCATSIAKQLRSGFNTSMEDISSIKVGLRWNGSDWAANLSSGLDNVDVVNGGGGSYRDWRSDFGFSYPLASDCTVSFSSSYLLRDDRSAATLNTSNTPSELVHDYSTWINRISTAIAIMKDLNFGVYADYMIRDSSADVLRYDRFNVGAKLTYVYEY